MKLFDHNQKQVEELSKDLSDEVEKASESSPEDLVFSIQPPEPSDQSVLPEAFTMDGVIPDQVSVIDTAESLLDEQIAEEELEPSQEPDPEEPAPAAEMEELEQESSTEHTQEKPSEPEVNQEEPSEPAEIQEESEPAETKEESEPAQTKEEVPTPSVTYASMAEAIEQSGKKSSDPTTRRQGRDIDDETLLAEIYALMGETPRKRTEQPSFSTTSIPDIGSEAGSDRPAPAPKPAPMPRPAANPNSDDAEPSFRPSPVVYGSQDSASVVRDSEPIELESGGVPGWVKGLFLFLITLLLSGMTFYAIATDLFGKVF